MKLHEDRNNFCLKMEHDLYELKKQGHLSKEEIFTCFERISTYVKHNTCIQDYLAVCRNRYIQNYIDYNTYVLLCCQVIFISFIYFLCIYIL